MQFQLLAGQHEAGIFDAGFHFPQQLFAQTHFRNRMALIANKKLGDFMLMLTGNVRTDQVLIGGVQFVRQSCPHQKTQHPVSGHGGKWFTYLLFILLGDIIGG